MRVVLDACVLFPTVLREILIGCAAHGMYRPIWSPRILEEWARATRKLGDGAEVIARGEITMLEAAWPDAAFLPREGDLHRLWLPDPDDIHVLATAIAASADMIVTFNAQDFPRATVAEEGIKRLDPDRFLLHFHSVVPEAVAEVVTGVHATAERLSGEAMPLRSLMKRARLPRLGKALSA